MEKHVNFPEIPLGFGTWRSQEAVALEYLLGQTPQMRRKDKKLKTDAELAEELLEPSAKLFYDVENEKLE